MTSDDGTTVGVFISHSSEDRALATQICQRLEAEGIACWIAPRNVAPGLDYDVQLVEAVTECAAFVVLISEHSNASRFVKSEAELAFSSQRKIYPVRLSDVQPARGLQLYLRTAHWTDMYGDRFEPGVAGLVGSLARLVKAEPRTSAPPPVLPVSPAKAAPADERLRRFIGANAAYYVKSWRDMEKFRRPVSWNWSAFALGPVWAAARKQLLAAAVTTAAVSAVIFGGVLSAGEPGLGSTLLLTWAACGLGFGLLGNWGYQRHTLAALEKIDRDVSHPGERSDLAEMRGGVSVMAALCFAALLGLAVIMAVGAPLEMRKAEVKPEAEQPSATASMEGVKPTALVGVQLVSIDPQIAEAAGLASGQGASVHAISRNSPAAAAGLKIGDVVVSINGARVASQADALRQLAQTSPGQAVEFEIQRRGATEFLTMTAIARPTEEDILRSYQTTEPTKVELPTATLDPRTFYAARWRSLSFYPKAQLWEFTSPGVGASKAYLVGSSGRAIHLDGTSPVIHDYNRRNGLELSTAASAADYLRFFCANVWGEEGAFRIVEHASDLPEGASAEMKTFVSPLEVTRAGDNWEISATTLYSDTLFKAHYRVLPDGTIEMIDDEPGPSGAALKAFRYRNGQRELVTAKDAKVGYWPFPPAISGEWQQANTSDQQRFKQLVIASER